MAKRTVLICKRKEKPSVVKSVRRLSPYDTKCPKANRKSCDHHPKIIDISKATRPTHYILIQLGIRKPERETKVSHHTLERILKGESVRRRTIAKITKRFQIG